MAALLSVENGMAGRATTARAGLLLPLVAALLASCAAYPRAEGPALAQPVFDPIVFFAGETRGTGTLRILFRREQPMRVRGTGYAGEDGVLRLRQEIERAGRTTTRDWEIRATGPGSYAATLSEADGPVSVSVSGNTLRIGYRTRSGERIGQTLRLLPGGRVAINRMTIRKYGMDVAVISETIVKPE
jgi:hypothetical protein